MIKLRNLRKVFGKTVAVDDVSFQIAHGEIFGFMGHNGAGKTTTIRMLLGLLAPTRGSASILGHDIVRESLAIRRVAGFLPGGCPSTRHGGGHRLSNPGGCQRVNGWS